MQLEEIVPACGRDKRVPPNDGSVCKRIRRGMLVMPAETEWIIQPGAADPTSASLREAAPTTRDLAINEIESQMPFRSHCPFTAVNYRAGEGTSWVKSAWVASFQVRPSSSDTSSARRVPGQSFR